MVSGLIIFIQLWCTEEKGPVFVTMFNPLSTLLVAVLAYFVLGEKLYMGRYILVLFIHFFFFLRWGLGCCVFMRGLKCKDVLVFVPMCCFLP